MAMSNEEMDKWLEEAVLNDEVSGIRNYLRLIGRYLEDEQANQNARVRAHLDAPYNPETDGLLDDSFNERNYELHGIFPTLLCNGAIVSICTFAEVRMRQLCLIDAERRKGSKLTLEERDAKWEELKERDGIKAYWQKNGIRIAGEDEWKGLLDVFDIRNQIVHADGELNQHTRCERIRKYVQEREERGIHTVSIINNYIIALDEYCEEALEIVKNIMRMQKEAMPPAKIVST